MEERGLGDWVEREEESDLMQRGEVKDWCRLWIKNKGLVHVIESRDMGLVQVVEGTDMGLR